MTLTEIQRVFAAYLRDDDSPALPMVAVRAQRGLPVYRHAYRASLIAALRDVFERTQSWIGSEAFETAARQHIAASPPHSWTMSDYGRGFDVTLATLYPQDPEVAELAWLDWSMRRAFDGADAGPLDLAALAGVDWDEARLVLTPTLAMRRVVTNCATLWDALAVDDAPAPVLERLTTPVALTVWRHDLQPRFLIVDDAEARMLTAAHGGATFGSMCAQLAACGHGDRETSVLAGAMLGRWIAEGVLVDVA